MPVHPPQYVETNGQQSWPPPIIFEKIDFHGFSLRGDRKLIQDLIDRQLNQPCGGALRFHVPSSHVLLYFADFPKCYFEVMRDKGWSAQREVGIWIPLLLHIGDGIVPRLCIYSPYVFVDNPVALTAGREVFGFFKEFGSIGLPRDPGKTHGYSLDTIGAEKYSSATEIRPWRLFDIDAARSGGNPWEALGDAVERVARSLELPPIESGDAATLFALNPSMVFLKQFRSIGAGQDACYQAITEVVPKIKDFRGFELEHRAHFHLKTLESHPLATDLGLSDQRVGLAFDARFDMQFPGGKILWTAA